jgi:hypothetical protein
VRIVRGNHLRTVWHHVRLFVMIALTAAVSLSLHKTVVHTAAAEPEQKPVTEEQVTPTVQLQPALLQADTPQSTTPIDTKPADTILRWTPTGTGDVQDAYNVRVAMDSTIDPLSHELTTNVQKNPNGLTAAELDATDLPEGTYFGRSNHVQPRCQRRVTRGRKSGRCKSTLRLHLSQPRGLPVKCIARRFRLPVLQKLPLP